MTTEKKQNVTRPTKIGTHTIIIICQMGTKYLVADASRPSRNSAKAKTQNLPFILPKLYIRIFFLNHNIKKTEQR